MPIKEPYGHGLPCNCYSRRVLLGLLPDPATYCPEICGTDIDIIGISDNYTVDGWYLQVDASNIVYMESGVITETVECASGLADYGHNEGVYGGYEAPHIFAVNKWEPLMEVVHENPVGFDYNFSVWVLNNPTALDLTGASFAVQYSTDGGTTWVTGATSDQFEEPTTVSFNTGTNTFIYRTTLTLANGCQFYNPAPDTGSPGYGIYYATIDMSSDVLFTLLGSINGVTPLGDTDQVRADIIISMADPYQSVTEAIGGIGIDFAQIDGGYAFEGPFYLQIITTASIPPRELAVVFDSSGTPVDTSPQGVATAIKNYVATYEFIDVNIATIQGFKIFGANVRFNEVLITSNSIDQDVKLAIVYYQIADSAFTFHVVLNPTNVQFYVTTAVPMTDVLIEDIGTGTIEVPLIEI